jgi:magnesium-transporting ATPase (P-type)
MSVIVTDTETGLYKLYMKGADNEVLKRLAPDQDPTEVSNTHSYINKASSVGFRVLLLASKTISKEELEAIEAKIKLIDSTENIHQKQNLFNDFYDEIERDLYLLGATSVEDRLQDKVPETI